VPIDILEKSKLRASRIEDKMARVQWKRAGGKRASSVIE